MTATTLFGRRISGRRRAAAIALSAVSAYCLGRGITLGIGVGECSVPAGPGEVECPPGVVPYFGFGVVGSVVGMWIGAGWVGTVLLLSGVSFGFFGAAVTEGPYRGHAGAIVWGTLFLVPPVVLVARQAVRRIRYGPERDLAEVGVPGVATVVSVGETGGSVNDDPIVHLTVRIDAASQALPPVESTRTMPVSRLRVPRPGETFAVVFDPFDPNRWEAAEPAADAGRDPADAGAVVRELKQLTALRSSGAITDDEFAARSARLVDGREP
ncbi:MAG TPA: SHOCT domain-containing protein [Frankiaceae bacterium]|nr:SHOCT domain-containing protein [Frankiaceae bacterium]